MRKPMTPCLRNCPDRTAECHADCEAYAQYKADMEAYRTIVKEARGPVDYVKPKNKSKAERIRRERRQH